jgi:hypothetical protein
VQISTSMSINQLAQEIKQATDYQKNRTRLREQMKADLVVHHNEGLFVVSPELIALLLAWHEDQIFVEDHYGNPILVDRPVLLEQAKQQYQRVLNRWHVLNEDLRRIRKI